MKTELKYGKEHCFDQGRVLVRSYCLEPNARDDRFESQFRRFEVYLDGVLEYVGPDYLRPVKEVRAQIAKGECMSYLLELEKAEAESELRRQTIKELVSLVDYLRGQINIARYSPDRDAFDSYLYKHATDKMNELADAGRIP